MKWHWPKFSLFKPPLHSGDAAAAEHSEIVAMQALRELGVAMVQTGMAVNDVEDTVEELAKVYRIPDCRVVVLPSVIILQNGTTVEHTEMSPIRAKSVRLDQAGDVKTLVDRALHGQVAADTVLAEVSAITASAPRFGALVTILGHALLSLGFGMLLGPTWVALPLYFGLGALVAAFLWIGRKLPTVATALPVFAAFFVTVVTSLVLEGTGGGDPITVLAPSLVSLLPGLTLTVAAIELTSNQVIAGASRVVYGIAQLLLLVFGVIAGVTVVGSLGEGMSGPALGWWAGPVGVLFVAIGFVLFQSAPRGAFLWILVALLATYAAQGLGAVILSPQLSGFIGALVVVPLARALERFRTAPPSTVMTLASFWLLVPGSLGFIGIGEAAQGSGEAVSALVNTGLAMFSIALGILVGTGLGRDINKLGSTAAGLRKRR